jgi:carboxyvinyl-carboxyphosphonate phosphorylmutase
MHWTDRRERFRAVLQGDHCVHPGSVFDPISARIAEELGFEIGMFAGSIASFTVLGAPDLIVLTLTEFAEQAYRINRAGKLPLLVDADHGYGNALNVMRTIQELETAGVAAASIEDTLLPRTYGETKPTLISIDEGVGKMRAALAAREDNGFVVVGRTSAAAITGTADAVARAKAYQAAGVDALFFAGRITRDQLDAIATEVKVPIVLGGLSNDMLDKPYLASRGATGRSLPSSLGSRLPRRCTE